MEKSQDLSGRRAVVTGGAAGLGLAIAHKLASAGATITVIDRESSLAEAALDAGWNTAAIDLAADSSLEAQRSLAEELGTVDVVVANAGLVPPWRRAAELDALEWRQVMAVNTWGVAATLGAFAPVVARSEHASMVVMASINGYKAHAQQVLYTASKHAVIGIMRAVALDLGSQGVRVNALAPGPVATPALLERIAMRNRAGGPDTKAALHAMASETALGEMVTPEQVASTALWLACDASAGVTGVVLPVESGLG